MLSGKSTLRYCAAFWGAIFFAVSCVTTPETAATPVSSTVPASVLPDVSYWDILPRANGDLIFIGVAAPRAKIDESIDAALDDAARKLSFYHGMQVITAVILEEGEGYFDFYADNVTEFSYDNDHQKYIDKFLFDRDKDVLIENSAVYVRCRYESENPLRLSYIYNNDDSIMPEWVNKPPSEISGYTAGVGYANAGYWHRDTMIKSYENAAAAILTKQSNSVSSDMSVNETNSNTSVSTSSVQFAKGNITGFLVIDTWINPKDKGVWTLAIANKQ